MEMTDNMQRFRDSSSLQIGQVRLETSRVITFKVGVSFHGFLSINFSRILTSFETFKFWGCTLQFESLFAAERELRGFGRYLVHGLSK